jgi:hypothetical protein
VAFKSPALLHLGDAQSPPQAAQSAAAAAAAAKADSERWDQGEQKLPPARARLRLPLPPLREVGARRHPPPPLHRAEMNWLEVRRDEGSLLSWGGNQWARARWVATTIPVEPGARRSGGWESGRHRALGFLILSTPHSLL